MMSTRTERDSMGELQVPSSALYQAQTQRAVQNFQISSKTLPLGFIQALLQIKHAAARANQQLGLLSKTQADAICQAATQLLKDTDLAQFPVSVYQTGSGTSSNMNVNEVLATLASQLSGDSIHPNDQVNLGQSSNDTIPTAIQLSSLLALEQHLFPALQSLQEAINTKSAEIGHIVKTGRTHLMDAMPVTFAQVLGGWHSQLSHAQTQLQLQVPLLSQLAQGGTAVGSGINAHKDFAALFAKQLSLQTGLSLTPSSNFFFNLSSQDGALALSGALKTLAAALLKIANDLRWMNSGPLAGLSEISLAALQPGSSIMPGKVNPVIPEAVAMASVQVFACDTAISMAAQSGNFELNVMLPLVADNVLEAISLLSGSCQALATQAIADFTVNEQHIAQTVAKNPILVTALNSKIGYDQAAAIAKQAYQQQRSIIDVAAELTELSRDELKELLDPKQLTGES
ncbi:lyase family protein [Alishewanella sp. SMS8]|uniref:class II fumarate hydratase n=1 Tax=Alishewanella sp. SMS8 TaxID=2994676 RepID=UPI0027412508|nr:class II fumarate hydratase [Alishewanella sp. SMS8]MDP4946055.1 class II fumarate hydratase [Alishewanella sp.]MDP5459010.1 class II fumarate hydratase [Alishewanella sp. SMS8]